MNPFYAGKIVHKLIKGEMVDGKIEPAISYTEFLKVQDILSGRTGKYAHQKENDRCPLKNTSSAQKMIHLLHHILRKRRKESLTITSATHLDARPMFQRRRCTKSTKIY
ncbi:MAG: hypothetical protein IKA34_07935 [Bacteroidales bacterium]|nr:hypothetical protein [Bacteroidales bacterium]